MFKDFGHSFSWQFCSSLLFWRTAFFAEHVFHKSPWMVACKPSKKSVIVIANSLIVCITSYLVFLKLYLSFCEIFHCAHMVSLNLLLGNLYLYLSNFFWANITKCLPKLIYSFVSFVRDFQFHFRLVKVLLKQFDRTIFYCGGKSIITMVVLFHTTQILPSYVHDLITYVYDSLIVEKFSHLSSCSGVSYHLRYLWVKPHMLLWFGYSFFFGVGSVILFFSFSKNTITWTQTDRVP